MPGTRIWDKWAAGACPVSDDRYCEREGRCKLCYFSRVFDKLIHLGRFYARKPADYHMWEDRLLEQLRLEEGY